MSRSGSLEPAQEAGGDDFWTGELDYHLPEGRIAQVPAPGGRTASRLLLLDRRSGGVEHHAFADLPRLLPEGALLVANDSRVLSARLHGRKRDSGGSVEALVLETGQGTVATAMVRASKPLHPGQWLDFADGVSACVRDVPAGGRLLLDFAPHAVADVLARCGELPLPPYIERASGPTPEDHERYQTVYARVPGSVAAPTAGLHFTDELLAALREAGFGFATVTLHVGPGTFVPVRGEVSAHRMEAERYDIPAATADAIATAKAEGRPVVAVGTTTVRALEGAAAANQGRLVTGSGESDLFLRPGFSFLVVDALITNLHLPGSTLIALVMALAGRDLVGKAYAAAVREGYRFYSYGDAMLIR